MRNTIELNLNPEDKSPRAEADKELNKAFGLISDRASRGQADAEDIAFAKSRRAYLSDAQLKLITGMTFDEIEAEASEAGEKELTVAEIKEQLTAKGIEFDPKAKKPELQALLDSAE